MVTITTTLMHKRATLKNIYAGYTQREIFPISQTTLYFPFLYLPCISQVYFGFASEKITILITRQN